MSVRIRSAWPMPLLILVFSGFARADDPPARPEADVARRLLAAAETVEGPNPIGRALVLMRGACLLHSAGANDEAGAAWDRAVTLIERETTDEGAGFDRIYWLSRIAEAQYECGDRERARATVRRARDVAVAQADVRWKRTLLDQVLTLVHRAGDDETARALSDALAEIVGAPDDQIPSYEVPVWRVVVACQRGEFRAAFEVILDTEAPPRFRDADSFRRGLLPTLAHYAQARDRDAAGPVLDEALPLAYAETYPRARSQTLAEFAMAQARLGRAEEALKIIETLPVVGGEPAEDNSLVETKAKAMEASARSLAEAGRHTEARRLLDDLLRLIDETDTKAVERRSVQEGLVRSLIGLGDWDAARAAIAKLPEGRRVRASIDLAEAQRRRGDLEAARRTLADTRRAVEALLEELTTNPHPAAAPWRARDAVFARVDLAELQARQGETEAAEATIAAIDDAEQAGRARARVAAARAGLGDVSGALAWIEGFDAPRERLDALLAVARALEAAGR
jgi:hypothetical protein